MGDTAFLIGLSLFFCGLAGIAYQVMFQNSWFNHWQWDRMVKKEFAPKQKGVTK